MKLPAYYTQFLACCEGEERDRAETLAPSPYVAELGWYLLDRR